MNLSPFHLLKNKLWMPSFSFISIFIKKYGNPSFHNFAPLAKISQINLRIHFRSAKLFLVKTFLRRTISILTTGDAKISICVFAVFADKLLEPLLRRKRNLPTLSPSFQLNLNVSISLRICPCTCICIFICGWGERFLATKQRRNTSAVLWLLAHRQHSRLKVVQIFPKNFELLFQFCWVSCYCCFEEKNHVRIRFV